MLWSAALRVSVMWVWEMWEVETVFLWCFFGICLCRDWRNTRAIRLAIRMTRWTLILQGYSYELRNRAGSKHQNADALCRIPVVDSPVGRVPIPPGTIQLIETLKSGLVTAADIGKATGNDPVLACIHRYLLTGWPANVDTAHKKFYAVKEELSLQGECLLRGARMVVPLTQRRPNLEELH